jgi:hypothetical protein
LKKVKALNFGSNYFAIFSRIIKFNFDNFICEISGSHGGEDDDDDLGFGAV